MQIAKHIFQMKNIQKVIHYLIVMEVNHIIFIRGGRGLLRMTN